MKKGFLSLLVLLVSFGLVLGTVAISQSAYAKTNDPLIISVNSDWVETSNNMWSFEACWSEKENKGVIQQKIKGKWVTLKKVKKSRKFLNGGTCSKKEFPISYSWQFTETKVGKKTYRWRESGNSWSKSFIVVAKKVVNTPAPTPQVTVTVTATPSAAPVTPTVPAAPTRLPYSSRIASLSSGLDSSVDSALARSLNRGDISCATQMQSLSYTNFSGYQERYQSGQLSEGSAINSLESAWRSVYRCS